MLESIFEAHINSNRLHPNFAKLRYVPSMNFLIFLVGSLVVYRLSLMFSLEAGPGRIFKKLRNIPAPKSATKEGMSCIHCSSVWYSAPVTAFLWWLKYIPAWETPLYWFAFSAVAIVLHHAFTENFKK